MFRREMILGAAALGLAACTPVDSARIGPDGLPLPQVYNIKASDTGDIQFRMAWMNQSDTRAVVLAPNATRMGFAWFQEPAGKLWWTMTMGGNPTAVVSNFVESTPAITN